MTAATACGDAPEAESKNAADSSGSVASTGAGAAGNGGGSGEGASTSSSGSASGAGGASPTPCAPVELCTGATEQGACRHELELPDGKRLYYWSNLPLEAAPGGGCWAVARAILVQHGNARDPWSYFESIALAAEQAGVAPETLIVAPYFPADEDAPPPEFHRWEPGSSGWKSGDASVTDPPLSSFSVYDQLVADRLLDRALFPSLEEIVVTGHSAGGQFTQRYAVATDVSDASGRVAIRVVVLNPSSYLYLDAHRWDGVGAPPGLSYGIPSGTGCDDDYDDYKYGLTNVPAAHYVAAHMATIPASYLARPVTYLLGEADTEADSGFDASCPAELQGEHRFERGLVFGDYLDARFAGHAHGIVTVPNVGHDHDAMYASSEAATVLFP